MIEARIEEQIFGYDSTKREALRLAKYDCNVLLLGESGVGKYLFAQYLHQLSKRCLEKFSHIHCPNIQSDLFESTLFGHRKGSFTDAKDDKIGAIEEACRGTIFLDEIGDLSLECQAKILLLIEYKKYTPLGCNEKKEANVRFIFATNKDLKAEVINGKLRKDLYYRITSHVIEIPALREDKANIIQIAQNLWNAISGNFNYPPLTDDELAILCSYSYPGNARELKAILENIAYSVQSNHCNRQRLIESILLKYEITGEEKQNGVPFLLEQIMKQRKSFWEVAYEPYRRHEIKKEELVEIILMSLQLSCNSYKKLAALLNIQSGDYKKFINFLYYQGIMSLINSTK